MRVRRPTLAGSERRGFVSRHLYREEWQGSWKFVRQFWGTQSSDYDVLFPARVQLSSQEGTLGPGFPRFRAEYSRRYFHVISA